MIFPGAAAPQAVSYLFIDGGSLLAEFRSLSEKYFDAAELPIVWSRFRADHRKVYYYDAIPVKLSMEDDNAHSARVAPKREQLATIEREAGFHVRTGDVRYRRRRGNEQKMVDVQFAVDALLMASRGLFSAATLITGDLDFKPLVTAMVEMGVDVRLRHPVIGTNEELIAAADVATPLSTNDLMNLVDTAALGFQVPEQSSVNRFIFGSRFSHGVVHWDAGVFGQAFVAPGAVQGWELLAEVDPLNPGAPYCLQITAGTKQVLKAFALESRGIDVPPW